YRGSIDDVIGLAGARRAFLEPDRPVAELIGPVYFVPEQATVETLLKVFREQKDHIFLVVDEYGGTAGVVTLEDLVETLLDLEIVDEIDTVEDLRAAARLKWRERAAKLGVFSAVDQSDSSPE
ncbi:MAG: CBS domain-containing protein, partial [Gemmatimonadetes bacterium]|nr:CBS domain-containing protein [Gemmatimonadota bacterium]